MSNLVLIENGMVPVYETDIGDQVVNARELHKNLEVKTRFATWIADRIEKYNFIDGEDFFRLFGKSTGGRPTTEYIFKIDTAKEIAMVENNEQGRIIRRYFIEVEKRYRILNKRDIKQIASREASKIVRNMLTDTIRDIIPESPHKQFAYPNYTRLIYKLLFNKSVAELRSERGLKVKDALRDFFGPDELEQIQQYELIITGLIHAGMSYTEIKEIMVNRHNEQAKITGSTRLQVV